MRKEDLVATQRVSDYLIIRSCKLDAEPLDPRGATIEGLDWTTRRQGGRWLCMYDGPGTHFAAEGGFCLRGMLRRDWMERVVVGW